MDEVVHDFMKGPTEKYSQFRLSGWFSATENKTIEIFGAAQPVPEDMVAKGYKKIYDIVVTKTSTSVPFVEPEEVPQEPETTAP